LLAAMLMMPVPTMAQPAAGATSGTCAILTRAYVANLKALSYETFAAGTARSAPQATQLATEKANTLALIQLNLDLIIANRCPAPTAPVSTVTYAEGALTCALAEMKGEADKDAKCNRDTWKSIGSGAQAAKPGS